MIDGFILYLIVSDLSGGLSHICKIIVITSQTAKTSILHLGGSVRIGLWIPGQQRGYTTILMYLKYSTN